MPKRVMVARRRKVDEGLALVVRQDGEQVIIGGKAYSIEQAHGIMLAIKRSAAYAGIERHQRIQSQRTSMPDGWKARWSVQPSRKGRRVVDVWRARNGVVSGAVWWSHARAVFCWRVEERGRVTETGTEATADGAVAAVCGWLGLWVS